jgi:hypothetical protein
MALPAIYWLNADQRKQKYMLVCFKQQRNIQPVDIGSLMINSKGNAR